MNPPSAVMLNAPALFTVDPVCMYSGFVADVKLIVPLFCRTRPLLTFIEPLAPVIVSVTPLAMVVVPAASIVPPLHVELPFTVRVPVPPNVPLVRVRFVVDAAELNAAEPP